MTTATKQYTCQCTRCDGSGKYDRGTCFGCNGIGFKNQKTKPRGLVEYKLTVTYSNGSKNHPTMYAATKEKAVRMIERYMRIKGWDGSVE